MITIIDVLFFTFCIISLYMMNLFLILHFRHKKRLDEYKKSIKLPFVSIIIPAYNEEKNIKKSVGASKKLDYPKDKFEIIVVDDGSSDRTTEIAKKMGVKVIRKKRGGKASALNLGIKHSKGEIIGCLDADSYPEKDALKKMIGFFNEPLVASVTPSALVSKPKNILERMQDIEYAMISWNRKLLDFIDSVYVTPGTLSLYRKDVVQKIGGFDEKSMTEDIDIAWRIRKSGFKIKMAFSAKVFTTAHKKFRKWWHQRIRWDIGGIQVLWKNINTIFRSQYGSLGTFISPFFLASMIVSILGFAVFTFLIFNFIFFNLSFMTQSYALGSNPWKFQTPLILPNVFTVLGVITFFISLFFVRISFSMLGRSIKGFKNIFILLLYLTFYISLFPILLIQSFLKMIRGKYEW